MERTIKQRNVVLGIIFAFITCGIYSIYWYANMVDDINALTGQTDRQSGVMTVILTICTCGIYGLVWMYRTGQDIDNLYVQKGEASGSRSMLYLILGIIGLGIVDYALIQSEINKANEGQAE